MYYLFTLFTDRVISRVIASFRPSVRRSVRFHRNGNVHHMMMMTWWWWYLYMELAANWHPVISIPTCFPSTSKNISFSTIISWFCTVTLLRLCGLRNSSAILATLKSFDWHWHWLYVRRELSCCVRECCSSYLRTCSCRTVQIWIRFTVGCASVWRQICHSFRSSCCSGDQKSIMWCSR